MLGKFAKRFRLGRACGPLTVRPAARSARRSPIRFSCVIIGSVVTSALLGAGGCTSSWVARPAWPWPHHQGAEVAKIVPIWSDTVLYQSHQPGIRGFGARVYFYDEEGRAPITADGAMTVYAFDGQQAPGQGSPLKKFVFPAEHLARYHSRSKLGHSYSLWLPWDEIGGPPLNVSLVARFESKDGQVVISEPARKLLPGLSASPRPTARESSAESRPGQTDRLTGETADEPADDAQSFTIPLTPGFASRLMSNMNEPAQPDAAVAVTAASPPPAADSRPSRFPARSPSRFPQGPEPLRRQPYPATWQSGLPPTPRSAIPPRGAASGDSSDSG